MGDFYRGGRAPPYRKRRYRDDDEYEGGRYGRPYEESAFSKIKKETLTIAETPLVRTEDAIRNITKNVVGHFEEQEVRDGFQDLVQALIVEQPFKIPFIATVVLLINSTNPEISQLVVTETVALAKKHLEDGDLRRFKLELRFLGCLSAILEDAGILPVLEAIIERARILQESGDEELPIELTRIALINIPYLMSSSQPIDKDIILPVLEKCIPIVNKKHSLLDYIKPFSNISDFEIGTPAVQLLLQQLTSEAEKEWPLHVMPRPWEAFPEELQACTRHALPPIEIPEEFPNVNREKLIPEVFFSVYFSQAVETIPPPSDISSSIFRDAIIDTTDLLHFNRLAVARFLIDIDCYFSAHAFIKRATPFDRVKEMAGDRSTWKSEDVVVDAVFSQLFRLPKPENKPVYYHSVLTEICKLAPAAIAPSLGRAIRAMYGSLESMDVELIERFIDWFSHHLSNFGFTWKWSEWTPNLELPDIHPKKAFILETVEKEIRLSFTSRIKSTLPDEYHSILSEGKQKDTPDFKFEAEDAPFAEEGKHVLKLLKERATPEDIDAYLATITEKAASQGHEDPAAIARDIYVTSICHIGSKSLSHVLSCIERCKLKLMNIGAEHVLARRQIISSVLEYWSDHPGVGANVVDKLLNYSILTPASVVEWVLLDAGRNSLSKSHTWEMVNTTINKVNNRVKQIERARPSPEAEAALTPEQKEAFETTLAGARMEQKLLAQLVLGELARIAETSEGGEEEKWVAWWGNNWLKTFTRKFKLEKDVVEDE